MTVNRSMAKHSVATLNTKMTIQRGAIKLSTSLVYHFLGGGGRVERQKWKRSANKLCQSVFCYITKKARGCIKVQVLLFIGYSHILAVILQLVLACLLEASFGNLSTPLKFFLFLLCIILCYRPYRGNKGLKLPILTVIFEYIQSNILYYQ